MEHKFDVTLYVVDIRYCRGGLLRDHPFIFNC